MAELQLTHIFKILTSTGSKINGLFLFFENDLLTKLNNALKSTSTKTINSCDNLLDIYDIGITNDINPFTIYEKLTEYNILNSIQITMDEYSKIIEELKKIPIIIGQFKVENNGNKITLIPDKIFNKLINKIKINQKVYMSFFYKNHYEYKVNSITTTDTIIELTKTRDITEQSIIDRLSIPNFSNIYFATRGGSNKSLPRQTRHFTRKIRPSVNSL